MQELAILAIVLILLGWIGYRLRRRRQPGRHGAAAPTLYHAVTISPCRGACSRARALWNIRYLSKEAPRLPLSGCDARPCHCRYLHYDDRRTEERRSPFGIARNAPGLPPSVERRQTHRRKIRSPLSA